MNTGKKALRTLLACALMLALLCQGSVLAVAAQAPLPDTQNTEQAGEQEPAKSQTPADAPAGEIEPAAEPEPGSQPVPAAGETAAPQVTISLSMATMGVGAQKQLTATVENAPEGTEAVWSSSAPWVATVDQTGLVSGHAGGETAITAKITVAGEVYTSPKTRIIVGGTYLGLQADGTAAWEKTLWLGREPMQLTAVAGTSAPEAYELVWNSTDPGVAAVDDTGLVTAVSLGQAVVSAQMVAEGATLATAYCTVTVGAAPWVYLRQGGEDIDTLTVNLWDARPQLEALVVDGYDNIHVYWESSDEAVATVAYGTVTLKGAGTATITAKVYHKGEYFGDTCTLTVTDTPGIAIRKDGASVTTDTMGTTDAPRQYTAALYNAPAGTPVTWASSNPAVATVDATGLVTPAGAGNTAITAEMTVGGQTVTARCELAVVARIRVQLGGQDVTHLDLRGEDEPFQLEVVLTDLPEDTQVVWKSTSHAAAFVGSTGLLYPGENGTATVTATAKAGYAGGWAEYTWSFTVTTTTVFTGIALDNTRVELVSSYVDSSRDGGSRIELKATTEPVMSRNVQWYNSSPGVVYMNATKGYTNSFTGLAPGRAVIVATSPDGRFSQSCVITVVEKGQALELSLEREDVILERNGEAVDIELTRPEGYKLYMSLMRMPDYGPIFTSGAYEYPSLGHMNGYMDYVWAEVVREGGKDYLRLTPTDTVGYFAFGLGVAGASGLDITCRVRVVDSAKTGRATVHAVNTAVTLNVKSGQGASIPLWYGTNGAALSLRGLGPESLKFVGVDTATQKTAQAMNEKFTLTADGETGLTVTANDPAGEKKAGYRAYIAILPRGADSADAGAWVRVKEAVSVNVSTAEANPKAAAVAMNAFYDNHAAAIAVIGGEVARMAANEAKTKPAVLEWLDVSRVAGEHKLAVLKRDKKYSGTLYVDVWLKGWNEAADAAPYTIPVKVSSAPAPPATVLSAKSVRLFDIQGDSAASTGVKLVLKPKKSGTPFTSLGFEGVAIPDADQNAIYKVSGLDPVDGSFTLSVRQGQSPAKGKLRLAFQVGTNENTGQFVYHELSITPVSADTRIALKADKTSVTLNPRVAGDGYTFTLMPSVADYDLSRFALEPVQICNSKGEPLEAGEHPLTAPVVENGTLRVALKETVPAAHKGKTYQLKLVMPGVNAHAPDKYGDTAAALTLKVAVSKGGKVSMSGSIKGSIDLTRRNAVTLNLKYSGTAGPLKSSDIYISDKKGEPLMPGMMEFNFYDIQKTGPSSWSIALKETEDHSYRLTPGTCVYVQVRGKFANDNTEYALSRPVPVRFTATKPKITQSTKTVTLYGGNADSTGVFGFTLPYGCPTLSNYLDRSTVRLPVQITPANEDFEVVQIYGGKYAIMFKNKAAANRYKGGGSCTLRLNLYLKGNTRPITTVSLKVAVKRA